MKDGHDCNIVTIILRFNFLSRINALAAGKYSSKSVRVGLQSEGQGDAFALEGRITSDLMEKQRSIA